MRAIPRPSAAVWALLALALALRLAVVATTDLRLINDPADYDRIARSIADGHGYPDSVVAPAGGPSAFRPPLYPLFLAGVYAVTGDRASAARWAQAVLGTVTVALVGLLGWQLWGGRAALLALGVAAVYPAPMAIGSSLLSEDLFVPLELGALVATLALRRSRRPWRWALGAGVLVGLASLTRTSGPLLLIALVVGAWGPPPRLTRRAALAPALLVAAAALTIAPWAIRNAVVLHALVPLSTEDGYTLAGTYNEAARTDSRHPAAWRPASASPEDAALLRDRNLDEVALGDRLRSNAFDEISDHPGYVLEAGARNAGRLAHLTSPSFARADSASIGVGATLSDAGRFGFYVVSILAVLGALTGAARRTPGFVWLMPLVLALVVFVIGVVRFRAPIDPFLAMLAALALAAAWPRVRGRLGRIGRRADATGAGVGGVARP